MPSYLPSLPPAVARLGSHQQGLAGDVPPQLRTVAAPLAARPPAHCCVGCLRCHRSGRRRRRRRCGRRLPPLPPRAGHAAGPVEACRGLAPVAPLRPQAERGARLLQLGPRLVARLWRVLQGGGHRENLPPQPCHGSAPRQQWPWRRFQLRSRPRSSSRLGKLHLLPLAAAQDHRRAAPAALRAHAEPLRAQRRTGRRIRRHAAGRLRRETRVLASAECLAVT